MLNNGFRLLLTLAGILLLANACSSPEKPKQIDAPAGSPMAPIMHFQLAVYSLPTPSKDPLAVLREALPKEHPNLKLVDKELPKTPGEMLVSARTLTNVKEEYPPPDLKSLKYFGHGLDPKQAQALQESGQVFVLDFAHPKARVWEALRNAYVLAERIARETGGLLWDNETREVFSIDEWHKERLAYWTEEVPDVADQITIHAYQNDTYVRSISLGMAKFGLPDIVVAESTWSASRNVGHLINIFAQSMAEGAVFKDPGQFDLDLRAIKNAKVRDTHIESLGTNATALAPLTLKWGTWEEGDPHNRLIELTADRCIGNDIHAKQERMLSTFFGSSDSIERIDHNDELLAVSNKAKAQLSALRQAFNAGLKPGEFIMVKAPFKTPDGGQEWMWVEVTGWKGNRIKGALSNDPFDIPDLHSGQAVEVRQEDVFDYIRQQPDGSQEGNTTGVIIQKMQEAKEE
jgi:uncharacterized protein YegJ (DUF2314 family)